MVQDFVATNSFRRLYFCQRNPNGNVRIEHSPSRRCRGLPSSKRVLNSFHCISGDETRSKSRATIFRTSPVCRDLRRTRISIGGSCCGSLSSAPFRFQDQQHLLYHKANQSSFGSCPFTHWNIRFVLVCRSPTPQSNGRSQKTQQSHDFSSKTTNHRQLLSFQTMHCKTVSKDIIWMALF